MQHRSDELLQDLENYASLLKKWSARINLVAPGESAHLWKRHIEDSEQVFHVKHCWDGRHVDLGSGGGLPGLVCSILKKHAGNVSESVLIEADQRKCAFLRTVKRELNLNVTVVAQRIETVKDLSADVVTARALAPLTTLFNMSLPLMSPSATLIFQKGVTWADEVKTAQGLFSFDLEPVPSQTEPDARLLVITNLKHRVS